MSCEGQRLPALGRGRGSGISLGAPRSRGDGRGGHTNSLQSAASPPSSSSSSSMIKDDAAIRLTDNDAVGSRIAAIQHHYLESDPYTLLLGPSTPPSFRPPIINIGTYLRCRAIDRLIDSFLNSPGTKQKQIISLGSGSDSRYWRLHSDPKKRTKLRHYIELDFAELTSSKLEKVVRHAELFDSLTMQQGEVLISSDRSSLQSDSYSLLSGDLRTFASSSSLTEKVKSVLDPSLDTLILAECVLAYLSPESSSKLLQHLSTLLDRPFAICYEMCVAGDDASETAAQPSKFGTVMLSNLQARNLSMSGARAFSTVWTHATRFDDLLATKNKMRDKSLGRGTAKTLRQVWSDLDDTERQRLSRLQGLDEVEELEILLSHYAISWYSFDTHSTFLQTVL